MSHDKAPGLRRGDTPLQRAYTPEPQRAYTPQPRENLYPEKKAPHLLQMKTTAESFTAPTRLPTPIIAPLPTQTLFVEPAPSAFDNAKYLGQYSNCYLILEKETKLWIIDQHAFHERILFEEYTTEYAKHAISKQSVLTPIIIPASVQISAIAEEYKEKINELGFEIEILTNSNIALHTYPAFLNSQKIQPTFEELLNKLIQNEHTNQTQLYHLFYATLACHTAVRAGDPLNAELVQRLLQRSTNVDFFAHCPHGRPVIRQFDKKDVESWFLRI